MYQLRIADCGLRILELAADFSLVSSAEEKSGFQIPQSAIRNPQSRSYVNRNTVRFEGDRESAEDRLRAEGQPDAARAGTPGALAADGTLSSDLPGTTGPAHVRAARRPALRQLRHSYRHGDE